MATVTQCEEAGEECNQFDLALNQLTRDIIGFRYWQRPVTFDWYYQDFLYTNVRYVAVIQEEIENPKWLHEYEFWSVSTGPVIQARHFFKLRFWNGYYVVFQNYDTIEPFEDDQHITIEEILREDDGILTAIGMVREIVARTRYCYRHNLLLCRVGQDLRLIEQSEWQKKMYYRYLPA
jgi:hypothetical protein